MEINSYKLQFGGILFTFLLWIKTENKRIAFDKKIK